MPKSVPKNVTRAFEALVPTFLLLTLVWGLEWFVSSHTVSIDGKNAQLTLPILLMQVFKPLFAVQVSYPAALAVIVLMILLWSVGIHGLKIVTAFDSSFSFTCMIGMET